MSFSDDKILYEGLTFDDVLLVPSYSEVLPREVNLSTMFTRKIRLNTPVVSAAMDTVTEEGLAIAIAREGGIGVIHKNMSIERQAAQVKRVKRAENVMITDPITIKLDSTVGEAMSLMNEYRIGGIPVIDKDGILKGIVTNRDLRFENNRNRKITEVMTTNLITTNHQTNLEAAARILQKHKIEKLPMVDEKGKLIGLITYKDITKTKDRPSSCKDEMGRLRVAGAVGIASDTLLRVEALINANVDAVVIDTAHAHSKGVINILREVKRSYPDIDVVVGNIGTAEAAKLLIKEGADAVKVGIGPGSICTTRVIAGVGVPQLSAIYNVVKAIEGSGVPVIADGGIRYSGDIIKAIAAGADCIMAGSLFAGVEESPGDTIIYNGRKFKAYRGMGSIEAMQQGSKDRYFQDMEDDISKLVPEGIAARVPYKGTLSEVIYQMTGGLRAGMGYLGAKNIALLKKDGKFVRITNSGIIESHPHDVSITRESPNYSRKSFE
ncbi:MAG: IMP dehydrogenase [Bacteroidetes bacterium GWE2_41_25]|nr:MAG: IMP dehydrogenase [Bacteroidetes bacterium GWA2_40_15]OFX92751.1 MAG: IMP dehydrogenase [Bacteroidetes bacterium GWE2_41_25]OFX94870.1 MAG: IMP dehydrogenase [Bacteroidetes bacterium GWC2_40_22]OFY60155.1 MAG: IMP dehydrogenase [Bacteroidetes bacterium GWF2_41_9]HAM10829.1 IMP dehydrogenase [Bacteroidales bacterium]